MGISSSIVRSSNRGCKICGPVEDDGDEGGGVSPPTPTGAVAGGGCSTSR